MLPKEQRIPFLYLANDILQNSRRRGGEFVTEFWRILPGALKDVIEKGDDQAHSVVLRLVSLGLHTTSSMVHPFLWRLAVYSLFTHT